jgi:NitT/TauT family transport system substrate-binding protein
MRIVTPCRAVAAVALALALSSCGQKETAKSDGTVAIKVAGYEGINSATPFFVAQKQGYFKDAGLDVTYVTLASGAAAMAAALNAGEVDIGLGAASQWIGDVAQGVAPGKIIGELTDNNYVILGGKGIIDVKQLKGKIFAVSTVNSGDHLYSQAVLNHFGIAPTEVTWLAMGDPASRMSALRAGKVDATEMTLTNLQPELEKQIIVGADQSPVPFVANAIYARQATLDANKPALRRFLAAMGKAADWIRQHPDDAVPACQESGSSKEACQNTIKVAISSRNPYTWSSTMRVNDDGIKDMLPIVAAVVPQAKTLTVADVVDVSVAQKAP